MAAGVRGCPLPLAFPPRPEAASRARRTLSALASSSNRFWVSLEPMACAAAHHAASTGTVSAPSPPSRAQSTSRRSSLVRPGLRPQGTSYRAHRPCNPAVRTAWRSWRVIRSSMAGFDRLTDAKQRRTGPELPLDPRVQKGLGLGVVTKVGREYEELKKKVSEGFFSHAWFTDTQRYLCLCFQQCIGAVFRFTFCLHGTNAV